MTVPAIVDPQAVPQYAPSAFQTWSFIDLMSSPPQHLRFKAGVARSK